MEKPRTSKYSPTTAVETINELLHKCGFDRHINGLSQAVPSLFIMLFEKLFRITIPGIARTNPLTREEKEHNVKQLMGRLEWAVQYSLAHIDPVAIVNGETRHLCMLVQLFKELRCIMETQEKQEYRTDPGEDADYSDNVVNFIPPPPSGHPSAAKTTRRVTVWCDSVIQETNLSEHLPSDFRQNAAVPPHHPTDDGRSTKVKAVTAPLATQERQRKKQREDEKREGKKPVPEQRSQEEEPKKSQRQSKPKKEKKDVEVQLQQKSSATEASASSTTAPPPKAEAEPTPSTVAAQQESTPHQPDPSPATQHRVATPSYAVPLCSENRSILDQLLGDNTTAATGIAKLVGKPQESIIVQPTPHIIPAPNLYPHLQQSIILQHPPTVVYHNLQPSPNTQDPPIQAPPVVAHTTTNNQGHSGQRPPMPMGKTAKRKPPQFASVALLEEPGVEGQTTNILTTPKAPTVGLDSAIDNQPIDRDKTAGTDSSNRVEFSPFSTPPPRPNYFIPLHPQPQTLPKPQTGGINDQPTPPQQELKTPDVGSNERSSPLVKEEPQTQHKQGGTKKIEKGPTSTTVTVDGEYTSSTSPKPQLPHETPTDKGTGVPSVCSFTTHSTQTNLSALRSSRDEKSPDPAYLDKLKTIGGEKKNNKTEVNGVEPGNISDKQTQHQRTKTAEASTMTHTKKVSKPTTTKKAWVNEAMNNKPQQQQPQQQQQHARHSKNAVRYNKQLALQTMRLVDAQRQDIRKSIWNRWFQSEAVLKKRVDMLVKENAEKLLADQIQEKQRCKELKAQAMVSANQMDHFYNSTLQVLKEEHTHYMSQFKLIEKGLKEQEHQAIKEAKQTNQRKLQQFVMDLRNKEERAFKNSPYNPNNFLQRLACTASL